MYIQIIVAEGCTRLCTSMFEPVPLQKMCVASGCMLMSETSAHKKRCALTALSDFFATCIVFPCQEILRMEYYENARSELY